MDIQKQNENQSKTKTYILSLDNCLRPQIRKDQVYKVEKNSILKLEISAPLEITVNTPLLLSNAYKNFPTDHHLRLQKHAIFSKADYKKHIIPPKEMNINIIYLIELNRAGPIEFFFIYTERETNSVKATEPFSIIVEPDIIINNKQIKLNDIRLQSILSKSLGKYFEFENYFEEASKLKYNFIHFTPVQVLGPSESLYCIKDNNNINDIFFDVTYYSKEKKERLFKEQIEKCKNYYGLGCIIDIVLNHISNNSKLIEEHPECGYNLRNTPWLNAAFELDQILINFSDNFSCSKTSVKSQPFCRNENDLNEIIQEILKHVGEAKIYEFFKIDFSEKTDNFKKLMIFYDNFEKDKNKFMPIINALNTKTDLEACEFLFKECLHHLGEARNGITVDSIKFGCCLVKLLNGNISNKDQFIERANIIFKTCNEKLYTYYLEMLENATDNIKKGIRYEFIQKGCQAIKDTKPLISSYFYIIDKKDKNKIFACNGFIMDSDSPDEPTPNFIQKRTFYYFKRKVLIWGDCAKLRYGNTFAECSPYLINYMTEYIEEMAQLFNGFRIDSLNSVPLFIIEYLIQKARDSNPNLIIIAHLGFSKEKEIDFINKIGINLVIREINWCNDAQCLSSQIKKYCQGTNYTDTSLDDEDSYSNNANIKYLLPSEPDNIIFDLTHNNETYYQKYHNLQLNLTEMACNCFSSSAIGTTRGFDQLFPIQPSVVNENRKYDYDNQFKVFVDHEEPNLPKPMPYIQNKKEINNVAQGIVTKFEFKCLEATKVDLALNIRGWNPDVNLKKQNDIFVTEIPLPYNQKIYYKYVVDGKKWVCDETKNKEVDTDGNVNNVIEISFNNKPAVPKKDEFLTPTPGDDYEYDKDKKEFNLYDLKLIRRELNKLRNELSLKNNSFRINQNNQYIYIFRTFSPEKEMADKQNCEGFALICRTGFDKNVSVATDIELPGLLSSFIFASTIDINEVNADNFYVQNELHGINGDILFTRNESFLEGISLVKSEKDKTIISFNEKVKPNTVFVLKYKVENQKRELTGNIDKFIRILKNEGQNLVKNADLCDINCILYKCEEEEKDNTNDLRGTYSFDNFGQLCYAGISHLHKMLNQFKKTKEKHVIIDNIKQGDWLLKYTIDRLKDQSNLVELYNFLNKMYEEYTKLNEDTKLMNLTKIIDCLFNLTQMKLFNIIPNKDLVNFSELSRLLLMALPQFLGHIESARFKFNVDLPCNKLSIASGLPYFSTGYMRCWGRDTFFSFKGLFLIPKLFSIGKEILIRYASVMRHGLIPNLLDSGYNCRYNARDVTWIFLKSIVDYVEMAKDYEFFNTSVNMVFLSDDMNEHNSKQNKGEKKSLRIFEIIQEIIGRHARGINFREWRAGSSIDAQMRDEGFNIKIHLNRNNGFIYGGNKWNCGTWMDKIGSSEISKNRGHPATPRNGADIEILALSYFVLVHLDDLNKEGKYHFNSVSIEDGKQITFIEWAELLKQNVEKSFFIEHKNQNASHDNIYKDYISEDNNIRHECQLRPNALIALAIAPELFNAKHAINFIKNVEEFLVVENCIGIRTLDYTDKEYDGVYDNNNISTDYKNALGYNMHNGPEWVWLNGYYLLAKIIFNEYKSKEELFYDIIKKLTPFEKYIKENKWSGLPSLTNKNGTYCESSCGSSLCPVGVLIEVIDGLNNIKSSFNNNKFSFHQNNNPNGLSNCFDKEFEINRLDSLCEQRKHPNSISADSESPKKNKKTKIIKEKNEKNIKNDEDKKKKEDEDLRQNTFLQESLEIELQKNSSKKDLKKKEKEPSSDDEITFSKIKVSPNSTRTESKPLNTNSYKSTKEKIKNQKVNDSLKFYSDSHTHKNKTEPKKNPNIVQSILQRPKRFIERQYYRKRKEEEEEEEKYEEESDDGDNNEVYCISYNHDKLKKKYPNGGRKKGIEKIKDKNIQIKIKKNKTKNNKSNRYESDEEEDCERNQNNGPSKTDINLDKHVKFKEIGANDDDEDEEEEDNQDDIKDNDENEEIDDDSDDENEFIEEEEEYD